MTTQSELLDAFMQKSPFVATLGAQYAVDDGRIRTTLPFQEKLIGNSAIRALHGGAMAAFLELTATAQLFLTAEAPTPARAINITVDYLRQGKAEALHAEAEITKLGRRMASIRAEAWQSDRQKPVVGLLAHFVVAKQDD